MLPRLRAGLIHLSISAVIALISVAIVFCVWYPAPLHKAAGVTEVFLVLIGVDVVIGPVLTTTVYRPGKKSLKYDLAVIALLQLVAFGYGMTVVAEGRPAWLVFSGKRFDLVQAYLVDQRKIDVALSEYRTVSWLGPRWVSTHSPENPELRKTILFEAMIAGVDLAQHPEFYKPLEEEAESISLHAQALERLKDYNEQVDVDQVLKRWPEADAFLPMMAKIKPVTVLVNKKTAKVVAVVDLNPWK